MFAAYLLARGWTRYGAGFIDACAERHVDLSGDYGYTWELNAFSDGDGDGRLFFKTLNIEGDTLAELAAALEPAGRPAEVA